MVKFHIEKVEEIETRCLVEMVHDHAVKKAPRRSGLNEDKIELCQVLKLRIRETAQCRIHGKVVRSSFTSFGSFTFCLKRLYSPLANMFNCTG